MIAVDAKRLALRFMAGLPDLAVVDELVSPDAVDHETLPGWPPSDEGFRKFLSRLLADVPDLRAHVEDVVAEGDRVAVRVTFQGARKAKIAGDPKAGRPFRVAALGIFRFAQGRVVEHWGIMAGPTEAHW